MLIITAIIIYGALITQALGCTLTHTHMLSSGSVIFVSQRRHGEESECVAGPGREPPVGGLQHPRSKSHHRLTTGQRRGKVPADIPRSEKVQTCWGQQGDRSGCGTSRPGRAREDLHQIWLSVGGALESPSMRSPPHRPWPPPISRPAVEKEAAPPAACPLIPVDRSTWAGGQVGSRHSRLHLLAPTWPRSPCI